jgi:hypothetical protein
MSRRSVFGAIAAAVLLVGSGVALWGLPKEEPAAAQHDSDGLSDDEEREMLQEIGYLK